MSKIVRTPMTALDRGLAISARRAGTTIEELGEIFHREPSTIRRLMKRHNVKRPTEFKSGYTLKASHDSTH